MKPLAVLVVSGGLLAASLSPVFAQQQVGGGPDDSGNVPVYQTLPSKDVNPFQQQIDTLNQQLLERDAEIVHLRADVAIAQANTEAVKRDLQSVTLSDDVVKLLARYKTTFGGQWTWDNDLRRIVPLDAKEKR